MKLPAGIRTIRGQVGQSWNRFPSLALPRDAVDGTGISGPFAAVITGGGAGRGASGGAICGCADGDNRRLLCRLRERWLDGRLRLCLRLRLRFCLRFRLIGFSTGRGVRCHLEFLAPALCFVAMRRRGKKPQECYEVPGVSAWRADYPTTPIPQMHRWRPPSRPQHRSTLRRSLRARCQRCSAGCRLGP